MRKVTQCIIVLAGICLTAGAAQALPGVTIDAAIALPMPTGDFSDAFKPGFGVAADAFVAIPITGLQVGGHIGYNRFGADDSFDDGNMGVIEILPSVRYTLSAPLGMMRAFGQLGVGVYNWSSELEMGAIKAEDDGTDFGFAIGAGLSGRVAPTMELFIMPMYNSIQTEDESTNYFTVNVGVMF
jgi:hypothetical protein